MKTETTAPKSSKKEKKAPAAPKPSHSSVTEANKARRIAKALMEKEFNKTKPSDRGLTRLQRRAHIAELKRELSVEIALSK